MTRLLDLFCGAGGTAMGVTRANVAGGMEAIPPAYTEYIGHLLLIECRRRLAANAKTDIG